MFVYYILKRNRNALLYWYVSYHYGPITTSLTRNYNMLRFKDRTRRKSNKERISWPPHPSSQSEAQIQKEEKSWIDATFDSKHLARGSSKKTFETCKVHLLTGKGV